MTTPIKTRCPYCNASFQLHKNQSNEANAKIFCNQCSRGFSVNDNLILSSDAASIQSDETLQTSAKDPMSNKPAHQINNESLEVASEYDSLDYMLENMEPWSNPTSDSLLSAETASDSEQANKEVIESKNDLAVPNEEFSLEHKDTRLDLDTHPQVAVKPSTTEPSTTNNIDDDAYKRELTVNSVETDSLNLNDDSNQNNGWLEQLLAEESEQDNQDQNDTDLSQLLIDMGVPFGEENETNEPFQLIAKPQDNHHSTQTQARSSVDIMLWSAGCLALLLLLLAQYVIFNVDTLIKDPDSAKRLQSICAVAACSLPNADLNQLALADITHRASQINTSGPFSDIQATLNNQSTQAQLLPNLKVSLYGSDKLIGAFIAAPDDYLLSPQKQLTAQGQKQLWFTVPVENRQISTVTIEPIY